MRRAHGTRLRSHGAACHCKPGAGLNGQFAGKRQAARGPRSEWIAIEFVAGRPIDEYCEYHDIDLRSRVKLLALLADAAATAHRMLVVHRDIKPTNVLVTEDGRPKLIDFGIAAALSSTSDLREPTVDIRRLFTPHYAAPEQIAGEPVTVATDVFGLGALAYRVLTGRAPYSRSNSAVAYLLAVTQSDAEPPSRAAAAAGMSPADPRSGRRETAVAQLLDSAALELDRRMSGEPLVEASMLSLITQTNIGLGRYQEGLSANERELKILREHDGGALEIGQALSSRAELLREIGRWKEAEPVAREAIVQLSPLNAPRDLCGALFLLAVTLAHTGHERDAETTFHRVIELEERGDADLRRQRMFPFHGLAVTLGNLGRYAEGASYAKAALSIAKESYPADNPDLLTLQATYVRALVNTHRAAEAEPLIRQTIAAETRVLGAGHKDTLLAQLILSDDLLELHRDAEAATVALSDAQQLEALLGPDNMYTLEAWNNDATALCNDRREVEGLAILRRVEAARRRLLPPGDRYIYVTELRPALVMGVERSPSVSCTVNRTAPQWQAPLKAMTASIYGSLFGAAHPRTTPCKYSCSTSSRAGRAFAESLSRKSSIGHKFLFLEIRLL